jgi:hypothetical protein
MVDRTQPKRAANLVAATVPILLGGLVYLAFRPDSLLMFHWAAAAGLDPVVDAFRTVAAPHRPHELLVNSAPAGLWALSCTAWLRIVWSGATVAQIAPLLAVPALVGVGSEVAQALSVCPGTFDPVDMTLYLAGSLVGAALPTR